jgi:hypothetical protein
MDEEALLGRVLALGAPHPFAASIPPELAPWLLPVAWSRERLWALTGLPRASLDVDALRWHHELPWWRRDGCRDDWFHVRPADVARHPDAHGEHVRRTEAADLARPLHVMWRRDRWLILDGIHRLLKADLRGVRTVEADILRASDVRRILAPGLTPGRKPPPAPRPRAGRPPPSAGSRR